MGNLCAHIPNAVPKAQASPAFPQIRHYDKNAWPTQAGFSHTSAVPICPNQTEQVFCVEGHCHCATAIRGQVAFSYSRKYNRGGMVLHSQDGSFRYFQ
jgi:hypothetical protein